MRKDEQTNKRNDPTHQEDEIPKEFIEQEDVGEVDLTDILEDPNLQVPEDLLQDTEPKPKPKEKEETNNIGGSEVVVEDKKEQARMQKKLAKEPKEKEPKEKEPKTKTTLLVVIGLLIIGVLVAQIVNMKKEQQALEDKVAKYAKQGQEATNAQNKQNEQIAQAGEQLKIAQQKLEAKEKEIAKREKVVTQDEKKVAKYLSDKEKADLERKALERANSAKERIHKDFMTKMLETRGGIVYSDIVSVKRGIQDLADKPNRLKQDKFRKDLIVSAEGLMASSQEVLDKDVDTVPATHKTSYTQFRTAMDEYLNGSKELVAGLKAKDMGKIATASEKISEGAKKYQIGIALYEEELEAKKGS